jgi:NAD(P)-dependent dehydrogenase (short-subunit alcohol dehydrogenase family)
MRTKVAVVSGGGGGIGVDVCRLLSKEPDVARIVICQRGRPKVVFEEELRFYGVDVHFRAQDLSQPETIGAFARDLIHDFPTINYLVLTAGICPRDHHTLKSDDDFLEQLKEVNNVNAFGPICLIKALFPALLAGNAGVVAVSSLAAAIGGVATSVAYDSSKGALEAAMRHFSRHCFDLDDPEGARPHFVTIAPGPVATEMLLTMPPDKVAEFKRSTRTGKLTTPEEVAGQIIFSLKTPAQTGQTIHLNSGILLGR